MQLNNEVYKSSIKLWNYHKLNHKLNNSDFILVLGNSDINTIYHAINLFKNGLSNIMLISGGQGKITKDIWDKNEAEIFYEVALAEGIPSAKILLENKSTNTGENYTFSEVILKNNNVKMNKAIIVTKPYMERRAYATSKIHWPNVNIQVTSIPLSFDEYINKIGNPDFVINLMVGDLQRIIEYPKLGFQVFQDVADDVIQAYNNLIQMGFTKNLIK